MRALGYMLAWALAAALLTWGVIGIWWPETDIEAGLLTMIEVGLSAGALAGFVRALRRRT
jgi:hypothetical protein